ncbi:two-component system sensor histidine kinase CreC, partial [Desulfovibrio sp. OttesenSCG-928-C06]|nr:two-component system sensor histidine kinase CreC [Desulfovibrio sp. OttesenSCG-928-C06]
AAPILRNGEVCGVVSVGKPTNSISFLIAIAQKRFVLSLGLIALTAIVLGVGLSFWIARPVRKLTDYASAIRSGGQERLPYLGKSEIGQLGAALEEMQNRLEGKNYIEDYVRALTHELKSPITAIRGAGEILRDHVGDADAARFLDNIDTETARMHKLVDRMLQLSRLENVRHINKTRFQAEPFFRALTGSFQTRLAARNVSLEADIQPGMQLDGDEFLLGQAVSNLLANAIDFAPSGSVISLSACRNGSESVIRVRDRGDGVPEFAKAKVFDKFFSLSRPDGGKKSTGLGLPFVAEVMALHGGSIALHDAVPGLEAVIAVPIGA